MSSQDDAFYCRFGWHNILSNGISLIYLCWACPQTLLNLHHQISHSSATHPAQPAVAILLLALISHLLPLETVDTKPAWSVSVCERECLCVYGLTGSPLLQSTPLHLAAGYNRVRIVQLLLQHGADVHAKDKGWVTLKGSRQNQSAQFPVVMCVLSCSGLVPLHNACSYGHYEVTELLLKVSWTLLHRNRIESDV